MSAREKCKENGREGNSEQYEENKGEVVLGEKQLVKKTCNNMSSTF